MKTNRKPNKTLMNNQFILFLYVGLFSFIGNAQVKFPELPTIEFPSIPTINSFQPSNPYQIQNPVIPSTSPMIDTEKIRLQNQQIIQEVEYYEQVRIEQERVNKEQNRNFSLPSFGHMAGTSAYYNAFSVLNGLDSENYSISDVVFLIESAFYDNAKDFQKLKDKIIQTGELLKSKMDELNYDAESNTAKNLILFQYFSEDTKLGNENHKAFKYDFEDFWGVDDYSKMFVSKLLNTGTGQCHSLPLLYLMLAEQIGAEAYLSFSPNHSYIRFPDDDGNTFSLELTNGMFSTNSFILQSGYVKSEALQSQIYMQELSKKELLSQMYTDLAGGYIQKYGYDEFIGDVVEKSLDLYPNNINAQMHKANFLKNKFEYATSELNINPYDLQDLQNIANYPQVIHLLHLTNEQNKHIDQLGYQPMPMDAYIDWLNSVHAQKEKQESKEIHQTLKATQKPTKKKTKKFKHDPKQKEEVNQKIFH